MGHSSLLGIDPVPTRAAGRDTDLLGPGDSSDSGSDMMGIADTDQADSGAPVDVALRDDMPHTGLAPESLGGSSDSSGTGERRSAGSDAGREAADIGIDRIVTPGGTGADRVSDDEDPDLAFIDDAQAPADEEDEEEEEEAEEEAAEEGAEEELAAAGRQGSRHQRTRAATQPPIPGQQPNPAPDVPAPGAPDEADLPDPEDEDHSPGRT
jgi:nucleotide-binding universal stress UspA family protein